jgi:hypothetical protein
MDDEDEQNEQGKNGGVNINSDGEGDEGDEEDEEDEDDIVDMEDEDDGDTPIPGFAARPKDGNAYRIAEFVLSYRFESGKRTVRYKEKFPYAPVEKDFAGIPPRRRWIRTTTPRTSPEPRDHPDPLNNPAATSPDANKQDGRVLDDDATVVGGATEFGDDDTVVGDADTSMAEPRDDGPLELPDNAPNWFGGIYTYFVKEGECLGAPFFNLIRLLCTIEARNEFANGRRGMLPKGRPPQVAWWVQRA